jgi:hypothetical protein
VTDEAGRRADGTPDESLGSAPGFVRQLRERHLYSVLTIIGFVGFSVALTALQVAMFVVTGNRWALAGAVLLPVAAYVGLRSWTRDSGGGMALAWVLAVLGGFAPFYLA